MPVEPWIQTYTGVSFDLLNPRADDVIAEDIAHALSQLCRYVGHSIRFMSVAEHSVRVMLRVEQLSPERRPQVLLAALLHDAAEAYVGDISEPLKATAVGAALRPVEHRIRGAIFERFGLPLDGEHLPEVVQRADLEMLATEARDLMGRPSKPWCLPFPALEGHQGFGWPAAKAKREFMGCLGALVEEVERG